MKNRKWEVFILIVFAVLAIVFIAHAMSTISASGFRLSVRNGTTFERSAQGKAMVEQASTSIEINIASANGREEPEEVVDNGVAAMIAWCKQNGLFTGVEKLRTLAVLL